MGLSGHERGIVRRGCIMTPLFLGPLAPILRFLVVIAVVALIVYAIYRLVT